MRYFFHIIVISFLMQGVCTKILSQTLDTLDAGAGIERIIETSTDEEQLEAFADIFEELKNSPLNLNEVTYDELLTIPILTTIEAAAIVDYRNKFGKFFTVYELKNIPAIPTDKAILLFSFFFVPQATIDWQEKESGFQGFLPDAKFELRTRTITDLQPRIAFLEGKYTGSKLKQYNRLKGKVKNIFFSFLTEKDAGENSIIDHFKYYLGVKDFGFVKKFLLGSFIFEHGHGLAVWSPYAYSKGTEVLHPLFKNAGGVKEFSGSLETNYFNGGGATLQFNQFNVSFFIAKNNFDASIDSINGEVKSIRIDGFHRTEKEISTKNNLSSVSGGLQVGYSFASYLKMNALYFQSNFDKQFIAQNNYGIIGKRISVTSIAYTGNSKNIFYSGEIATSDNRIATINSIAFQSTRKFGLALSHRYYPNNYRSLYANGFSESSTSNETGLYLGLTSSNEFGVFNFYSDIYSTIRTENIGGLSLAGNDFLFDWYNKFGKDLEINLRYKNKNEEEKVTVDNSIKIIEVKKRNLRADIRYGLNEFQFRNRLEIVKLNDGMNETGFLVFQDAKFAIIENILVQARIIFFNTTSFSSAVYEFENDIAGVMTNLPMYGEGVRWYIVSKIQSFHPLSVSFKYSETIKPTEKSLSSGDSEVIGSLDNRFSLLLELRF